MSELQNVIARLNEIVDMESKESLDQLGSYIVGALIVDEAGYKLYQANEMITRIGDLGSDLETRNGGEEWMRKDWAEVKALVDKLNRDNA